jgi:uncharacterized membrane protein YedE/YeeE
MKKAWVLFVGILLSGMLALAPAGNKAWAAESSGYGATKAAPVEKAAKSGNGASATQEKAAAEAPKTNEGASEKAVAAPTKKAVKKKTSRKGARRRPRKAPPASAAFILSALIIGLLMGWVLQRGRFCMNSAFRDTIFIQDWTFFRAYILALMVSIIGVNALNDGGLIKVSAQPFWPFAHIIGGYVFGLGIVLAGGCGSGIWYRCGEGLLAAWVAVLGFFVSIAATMSGVLKPVYDLLRSKIYLTHNPTLYDVVGGANNMAIKWGVIIVLCIAGAIFVSKSQPFKLGKQKGYYWSVTGLLIGLISVAAFWASYHWGGHFSRGLSFTTPTIEFFNSLIRSNAEPTIFPKRSIGFVQTTWGVLFIIGVPIGAFLSAKGLKEFSWKVPPAKELLTVFFGSLMMGFGATTALGCNIGQGLTGFSTLSIGSIVATISIILGNWTMVYFKFIKPMQDLD